jgi:pyruvate/2-oxoglutarate dehydrogenase complex dihydrolipoamide acyltransferase (E2) component
VSTAIRMPNLGAETDEARVSAWLKQVGDIVAEGEAIAEIQTEKASVELEAPASGRISEILVRAECDVKVGTVLVMIEEV